MSHSLAHIELNVSDLARSGEFYDRLFSRLGWTERIRFEHGEGWRKERVTFFIFQAERKHAARGYHRKAPGLNHIAFHAPSREAVDQFRTGFLEPASIPLLYGGPKEYGDYGRGYYAVYFEDPDRVKLEYAYIP